MAAPTFVADYIPAAGWQSTSAPKTVSVTAQSGDYLVVVAATAGDTTNLLTPTGGTGITWTLQQSLIDTTNYCEVYIWTAPVTSGQTFTCSITNSSTALQWNYDVLRFSGASGIGAGNITNIASGAPSISLTTTQSNSAVIAISADWNSGDGSSRTWRTVNSITPTSGNSLERAYSAGSSTYTTYVAYWNDVGSAASNSYGLSAPSGQKYTLGAIEVKGTSSKAETLTDNFNDNSVNSSLWTTFGSNYAETGGQFTIFPPSNSPEYDGLQALSSYDFTSSRVVVKCVQVLSSSVGAETILAVKKDSANFYATLVGAGNLTFRIQIAGSNNDTAVTYDSNTMAWWRIREFAGTIYWDTSPDGCYWTNRRTATAAMTLTSMKPEISAGTWQNVASPGTAIFDNFNITSITSSGGWLKG